MTLRSKVTKIVEMLKFKNELKINTKTLKLYKMEYMIRIYILTYGENSVYNQDGNFSTHFLTRYREAVNLWQVHTDC